MEVFFSLLPILALACCGLPLLILIVALYIRDIKGKARLREIPSAPPLTQESEEVKYP